PCCQPFPSLKKDRRTREGMNMSDEFGDACLKANRRRESRIRELVGYLPKVVAAIILDYDGGSRIPGAALNSDDVIYRLRRSVWYSIGGGKDGNRPGNCHVNCVVTSECTPSPSSSPHRGSNQLTVSVRGRVGTGTGTGDSHRPHRSNEKVWA